jgi:hypothetical protein
VRDTTREGETKTNPKSVLREKEGERKFFEKKKRTFCGKREREREREISNLACEM